METNRDGETTRHATAALRALRRKMFAPAAGVIPLCAASHANGTAMRESFASVRAGPHTGAAFGGPQPPHRRGGSRDGAGQSRCPASVIPAGRLPNPPGAAGRLFQSVGAGVQAYGHWWPAVAVGCAQPALPRAPTRNATTATRG